jgi:hypothetical protein
MGAVKGKQLEEVKCPLCDKFSSKRLTTFETHLEKSHNTSSKELWVKTNGEVKCACGCGNSTTWLGWKAGYSRLRKGHNASIYSGLYSEEEASRIAKTRGTNWRGKESIWTGKTKETDERVAARGVATSVGRKFSFDTGKISIWSKGKTKETDVRLADAAEKQKERYATGEIVPWIKGLTKETDSRVAAMAIKVSIAHKKEEIRKRLDKTKRLDTEEIKKRIERNSSFEVVSDMSCYVNDNIPNIEVVCKVCEKKFTSTLRRLQYGRCFFCFPSGSAGQAEVSRFVQSLGLEVVNNCRSIISPLELDIWVPQKKFAIEYNGLYTHNELSKSSIYHSNKTEKCEKFGCSLFHVFEDEWNEKPEIIKSMIKHRLGMSEHKIFARKTKIIQLSSCERTSFFDDNHIDGDVSATICFALTFENKIVAALSLRKTFHKKYASFLEVARFCVAKNTSIVGGLSRLTQKALKYAIQNGYKDGLLTYVDTRHGYRRGYEAVNYQLVNKTGNKFWWTDTRTRFNRFKIRADYKAGLSESDVANEHGVVKIWGCPNLVFIIRPVFFLV